MLNKPTNTLDAKINQQSTSLPVLVPDKQGYFTSFVYYHSSSTSLLNITYTREQIMERKLIKK